MRKFFAGFKSFIARGNVMDMAVGVIIGAAFKAIVDSLVNDIISPVIGLFADTNFSELVLKVGGVSIGYGSFITAVINFFIMAFVLFMLLKIINRVHELGHRLDRRAQQAESPPAPATKPCPYCKSQIASEATRCPHCTSILE